MKRFLVLLSITLLFSCEKTIKYEIPELPPHFNIDGRIITGDTVRVFVARTEYSLSSKDPEVITNAQVRLVENNQQVYDLQWVRNSSGGGSYQSSYIPRANNTYRIEVENTELGLASGEDIALSPVEIIEIQIDSNNFDLDISFRDPRDTADFYAIEVFVRTQSFDYPVYLATADPSVDFFYEFQDDLLGDGKKYGYKAFLSDEIFDGRVKKLEFSEAGAFINPGSFPEAIVLEVKRISKDYYLHERSKGRQYTGGDNPFAEPVQIHSNIENGFGIVGAGAPTREIIEF